jgi:hypothetical protein
MDCNSYSYTGNGFASDDSTSYAYFENENGIYHICLEQWCCDRTQKQFVVYITNWENDFIDICENFHADFSHGWETARTAFSQAAELYNQYCPDPIPTF